MSFRLWVAVVRAYSVLVMPSKGKIGQQYHTPHQEERKKRGSGETHSSAHKSLNFHKEISCYILQCYLGNHFSVKGTLCLLLFVKLFEPPYLVKGCFTIYAAFNKSSIYSLLHHKKQYFYQQSEHFKLYLLRIDKIMS